MAGRSGRMTIRDIAALAGVSAGTVSRTINDLPGVGDEARARIRAIIEEHDFSIDSSARRLSTGRSHTIGVVFPLDVSDVVMHPVYPELLGAIGDAVSSAGYDLNLFTVSSPENVKHVVDSVGRNRVDGVLLPAAGPKDPLFKKLSRLDAPVILIGHRPKGKAVGWVDCTHDVAAAELTERMIANGRRRLVMLNGPEHVAACGLRSAGFWSAVRAAGDAVASSEEIVIELDRAAGFEAAKALLARGDVDGIVCAADSIASGVLDAARLLEIDIPGALEVSGFDDASFALHTVPPLTTVRMPLTDIGRTSVELLLSIIEGRDSARHVLLPTELVLRGSTR